MAKPVSSPTPWATNTNYSGGPAIGTPTKVGVPSSVQQNGWEPDQKPPAQWENDWHNEIYLWCLWVYAGVATAAETAHIIETDANGEAKIARVVIGPHTSGTSLTVTGGTAARALDVAGGAGQQAMRVTAGTGGTNGLAVTGSDSGGIAAVTVIGGTGTCTGRAVFGQGSPTGSQGAFFLGTGGSEGVEGQGQGAGVGVKGTGGANAGGAAFVGGSTAGPGVTGQGTGNAMGVAGTGGGIGAGVVGTGGVTGGDGIAGTGTVGGRGVFGIGGSGGGAGGSFTAGATSGNGIEGQTTAGALLAAAAVRGLAAGDATAILSNAADGYGVVAGSDTTSPKRSALRLVPQNADPTTPQTGDALYNSTSNEFRARNNLGWRTFWATPGFCDDVDEVATFNLTAVSYTAIASITVTAPRSGFVWVWVTAVLDKNTAASCDLRIRNTTTATDEWIQTGIDTLTGIFPCGFLARVAVNSGANVIEFQGQVPGAQYDLTQIKMVGLGLL